MEEKTRQRGESAEEGTGKNMERAGAAAEAPLTRRRRFALAAVHFFKSSVVLLVALAAAGITCIFVPVDREHLGYFDLQTLACLFCTLAVVAAFKNIRFFEWLADVIVRRFKNMRNIVLALVFVTYFGSMIMANDMALITFLPLGYFVLESCGNRKLTAFTFIMQNIAANLGGMLTPFGNPQNLYLYSFYSIGAGEFFRIMALPFAVAFVRPITPAFPAEYAASQLAPTSPHMLLTLTIAPCPREIIPGRTARCK